jgi:hypothetical protein
VTNSILWFTGFLPKAHRRSCHPAPLCAGEIASKLSQTRNRPGPVRAHSGFFCAKGIEAPLSGLRGTGNGRPGPTLAGSLWPRLEWAGPLALNRMAAFSSFCAPKSWPNLPATSNKEIYACMRQHRSQQRPDAAWLRYMPAPSSLLDCCDWSSTQSRSAKRPWSLTLF